jgi:DNA mismatch repair protein MutH
MSPTRPPLPPPDTLAELLDRAAGIAGMTLGQVAGRHGIAPPRFPRRHKGWTGILIERALGAASASQPQPDFPHLGVELKTLPVDERGQPRESTWVCIAPLDGRPQSWDTCLVRRKLACVLWVPIEAARAIPPAERRIGTAFLWRPSPAQEAQLRADWEEITDAVTLGEVDRIGARHGTWLQLRPKAADSRSRTRGPDADGAPGAALPRGFYLRAAFTAGLLKCRA